MTTSIRDRVAGAPISWGVCEAPGWGHELRADRVLGEMRQLGLSATELGPTGYHGADARAVIRTLSRHDLRLVGGFLPVPMHLDRDLDLAVAADAMQTLAAGDVNAAVAATVGAGTTSYLDAVRSGLYTPLGRGDLDIADCVGTLASVGYRGWYVIEQDCAPIDEPAPGDGPVRDTRNSLDFLTSIGA
jgi:sugar phosphate isomerase/epimerase